MSQKKPSKIVLS